MADPVIDTQFVSGTVITSDWLNGVNDYVNVPRVPTADLSDTSDVTKGDALVGVKQPFTGAVAQTQHAFNAQIINVKSFGAVGDGVADDSAALQAAFQHGANFGAEILIPAGTYKHNSPLLVQTTVQLSPALSGGQLHFSDVRTVKITGQGRPKLIAGAAMTSQIQFTFNAGLNNIAPFYSSVEGIQFDGANLATQAVFADFCMHMDITRCSFTRLSKGITNNGYGVAQYNYNVFNCTTGIDIQRGGDSFIAHNDFVFVDNGIGINCGTFSGNTTIISNIFSLEQATGTTVGVRLSGDASVTGAEEVRDVVIQNNEFSGLRYGVQGVAHASVDNVYNIIIRDNHCNHFGAVVNAALVQLVRCNDVIIENNIVGNLVYPALTVTSIDLTNCERIAVRGNKISNTTVTPILVDGTSYSRFEQNEFNNVGTASTGNPTILTANTATFNELYNNTVNQTSASYGVTFFFEAAGADNNQARRNVTNQTQPYIKVGAASLLVREEWKTAPDNTTQYYTGDVVHNTAPTLIKNISHWTCITAGAPAGFTAHGCGSGTTAQRPALGTNDFGYLYRDTTTGLLIFWDGVAWQAT